MAIWPPSEQKCSSLCERPSTSAALQKSWTQNGPNKVHVDHVAVWLQCVTACLESSWWSIRRAAGTLDQRAREEVQCCIERARTTRLTVRPATVTAVHSPQLWLYNTSPVWRKYTVGLMHFFTDELFNVDGRMKELKAHFKLFLYDMLFFWNGLKGRAFLLKWSEGSWCCRSSRPQITPTEGGSVITSIPETSC